MPGGYPFSSVANAVFLLGCVVKDASRAAFAAKLGVLAYYLMDLTGDNDVGPDGGCAARTRARRVRACVRDHVCVCVLACARL